MMMSLYVCPVCEHPLQIQEKTYCCAQGHLFDVAREGYVNLLLANQKRSADPGDSAAMIRNRRAFLEAGYYAPLQAKVIEILLACIELLNKRDASVLDIGCGEGYYVGGLGAHLAAQPLRLGAIDVSKFAIKAAARRYSGIEFAVAGAHHLPVADDSIDCLMSVFAPRAWPEFWRALTTAGRLLLVVPGPRHLWELKRLIYTEPQLHEGMINAPAGFTLRHTSNLTYDLHLPDAAAIQQLLVMTPFFWHMTPELQQSLGQLAQLTTPVDFQLLVFEKIA